LLPPPCSAQPLSDANFKKKFNRIYDWNLAKSLNRIYAQHHDLFEREAAAPGGRRESRGFDRLASLPLCHP
jgi:hypothetical protein